MTFQNLLSRIPKWNPELIKGEVDRIKANSKCETLWASPRMPYDYISAINVGAEIITMQGQQIKKLKTFGKKPEDYSLETVKQFYNDALSSGFKI